MNQEVGPYQSSNLQVPDRKSTRLNSSHLVISYAVFCLKKKKGAEPLRGRLQQVRRRVRYARSREAHPILRDGRFGGIKRGHIVARPRLHLRVRTQPAIA